MEGFLPLAMVADLMDIFLVRDQQKLILALSTSRVLLPILIMALAMSAELSLDTQDMEKDLLKRLMQHLDMAKDLQSQNHME